MKNEQSCTSYPVYGGMMPGPIPISGINMPMPMPFGSPTSYTTFDNYNSSSLEQRISSLEQRINNLEDVLGNSSYSSTSYNNTNYQTR